MLKKVRLNMGFINDLKKLLEIHEISDFKRELKRIKYSFINSNDYFEDGNYEVSRDWILKKLQNIENSKTIDMAKKYVNKLIKGLTEVKTNGINDINLYRWEEYTDIITDSLWIIDKRDNSGVHSPWYHGNFIPQIPRQMILRYTKKYDVVVDPFLGSGTTLIECKRLGRHGIGVELNENVAKKAKCLIDLEPNPYNIVTDVIVGDSRKINFKEILKRNGFNSCQLVIMHPPYHDIIKFSDREEDLSNAKNVDHFLKMFEEVVDNVSSILDDNRFLILVIGDKYSNGEWIPLGFYCMNLVLKKGFKLKSIVVKNFEETKGKVNKKNLWRYRALEKGFYIFKHEYIFIFQKVKKNERTCICS